MSNFNIKSIGLKDNPMNRHQRYKSQNIEINTELNKINAEESKNKEKTINKIFSPLNSKDFNNFKIKNNFQMGNSSGNFTSNNFNFQGNNKFKSKKINY